MTDPLSEKSIFDDKSWMRDAIGALWLLNTSQSFAIKPFVRAYTHDLVLQVIHERSSIEGLLYNQRHSLCGFRAFI